MTSVSRDCQLLAYAAVALVLVACAGRPARQGRGETVFLDELAVRPTAKRSAVTGPFKASRTVALAKPFGLVDVRSVVPGISMDLRYGTAANVTGRPLYPAGMPCLLHRDTAAKLQTAQSLLRSQGYGLRIWDGYRPPEVQQALYQAGAATRMFLSPENAGWSRHCGGIAVDATLVDAEGREQRMPTAFDAGLHHASSTYRGGDPVIARNLQILHQAMKQAGFEPAAAEWWHFDDGDYVRNPQPVVFGHELGIPSP